MKKIVDIVFSFMSILNKYWLNQNLFSQYCNTFQLSQHPQLLTEVMHSRLDCNTFQLSQHPQRFTAMSLIMFNCNTFQLSQHPQL